MEKPELVIYCLVDEPNAEEQAHSTFAQNIVREILEEVLPYMNVYRDEESTGINAGLDVTGNNVEETSVADIANGTITGIFRMTKELFLFRLRQMTDRQWRRQHIGRRRNDRREPDGRRCWNNG